MKNVVVTGADRGLGLELCRAFAQEGFRVFAGQYLVDWPELHELSSQYSNQIYIMALDVSSMESVQRAAAFVSEHTDCVDILVNNAGISSHMGNLMDLFNVNSLGALRMTETFLPMMRNGMKRLCYISSEAGSIAVCHRTQGEAYSMSKAALNMAIRHMHNQLFSKGYTFRVYHPGWLRSYMTGKKGTHGTFEPAESARPAVAQFIADRNWEDCLVMLDNQSVAWPF